MIIFKKLTFQNAFSWSDRVVVPLDDQGVVFISGKNGAGKSSIFEVLTHAIYQATSKGLRKNAIINRITEEDYAAELEFEADGHQYKIRQYRRHEKWGTKTHFFKDGELQHSRNTSPDEVHRNVIQEIGMVLKEFLGIVYLSQGMTHILVEGRPAERKTYLSSIFQLDVYDKMQENAEEQLSGVKKKLEKLAPQMLNRESLELEISRMPNPEVISNMLFMLKMFRREGKRNLTQMRQELQELNSNASLARHRDALLAELPPGLQLAVVRETLFTKIRAEKVIGTEARTLETKKMGIIRRQELMEELDSWGGMTPDLHKIEELRSDSQVLQTQIAELNERIRSVNKWNSLAYERDRLRRALSGEPHEIKSQLREAHHNHSILVENGKRTREQVDSLREIGKAANCPKCLQELDPDAVADHVHEMSQDLSDLRLKVHNLRKQIGRLENEERIADELLTTEARMAELRSGDVDQLNEELDELKTDLDTVNKRVNIAANVKLLTDEIGKLPIGDSEKLSLQIYELEEDLIRIQEAVDELRDHKTKLESLESLPTETVKSIEKSSTTLGLEIADMEIHLEEVSLEAAITESRVDKYVELESKLQELEGVAKEYRKWKVKKELLDELRYCFGPKGLKMLKLKQIVSAIQEILPTYTSIMFDDDPMDFVTSVEGNDLEMVAIRKTKNEDIVIPVKGLSGGQRQRLTIALLFTLQKILSPNKRSNVLILDEVGAHLDVQGRDAFIELIQKLKGDHASIFIMTHDVQLAGAVNYDQMWQIDIAEGVSSFEQEYRPVRTFVNPNKPAQSTI